MERAAALLTICSTSLAPQSDEPHPQAQRNPSCGDFVKQLESWLNDSSTRSTYGYWMMKRGYNNPYEKLMPGDASLSKMTDRNGFQFQLVNNNQGGDVYRHVLFFAGSVLSGESIPRYFAYRKDEQQVAAGRKESTAELAGNKAGIEIGKLLNNNKLSSQDRINQMYNILCAP